MRITVPELPKLKGRIRKTLLLCHPERAKRTEGSPNDIREANYFKNKLTGNIRVSRRAGSGDGLVVAGVISENQ